MDKRVRLPAAPFFVMPALRQQLIKAAFIFNLDSAAEQGYIPLFYHLFQGSAHRFPGTADGFCDFLMGHTDAVILPLCGFVDEKSGDPLSQT